MTRTSARGQRRSKRRKANAPSLVEEEEKGKYHAEVEHVVDQPYMDPNGRKGAFTGQVKVSRSDNGATVFQHIFGKVEYKDKKEVYEGEFARGMFHGQGKFTKIGVAEFQGTFQDGFPTHGVIKYEDESVYEGDVGGDDSEKHGSGVYKWHDGVKYVGQFKNGLLHGSGVMTWEDGEKHIGEFKEDKYDGYGTHIYVDDENFSEFKGEWKEGEFHGHGIVEYRDGTRYCGQWEKGKCQGHGTFTYGVDVDDGLLEYSGNWEQGKQHGHGTMKYKDESFYCGLWKHGKKHGPGELTEADGTRWVGKWRNDAKHGKGVTYHHETL